MTTAVAEPGATEAAVALAASCDRWRIQSSLTGLAGYGINPERALGISIRMLRTLARRHRRNHWLAGELWRTGIHEVRLSSLLGE